MNVHKWNPQIVSGPKMNVLQENDYLPKQGPTPKYLKTKSIT